MVKQVFDQDLYKKATLNDLIIFAIQSMPDKECKFEPLAEKCFSLFPQSFSLSGYPGMSDTRKLDRPLRYLRKRGLIKGDPKTSFCLTKKGKKRSLQIAEIFRQTKLL